MKIKERTRFGLLLCAMIVGISCSFGASAGWLYVGIADGALSGAETVTIPGGLIAFTAASVAWTLACVFLAARRKDL